MRNTKTLLIGLLVLPLLVGLLVNPSVTPTRAQGQNLLTNPNFEPPYSSGVAQGWSPWYEDSGDLCSTKPDNWDFVCRPEWTEELDYNNYGLTRGGSSQHVGAQYITWHGGVYQTVQVEPGTRVRFSVQGYSRATNDQVPAPSYGGNWVPRMQVGIDPEGRGNWAQGVTWSAENNGLDSWQSLSIEATAGESGQVSVFVSSHFRRAVPVAHQDTWWDSAVLEVVQPAATPTSTPQPTSAIPPTPVNTPTPRPDGAIVHIVQSGDTLYGIALQYDVPVDELRRLNAGTLGGNDLLVVGQEIIISVPEQTATPEPTVAPTAEATEAPAEQPAEQPEEAATPAPSGDTASLCVVAYHDRNQDRMQQPESEELLPNATFTLVGTNGTAGTYTTDGIEEPHCFENLQPDSYVLRQTPPAGYEVVGPGEMGFQLNAGQVFSYQQGYVRQQEGGADAAATPGPEATPQEETSEEGSLNITLNKVIRWAGIAVVVLLIVVAGLFFVSRRQMS